MNVITWFLNACGLIQKAPIKFSRKVFVKPRKVSSQKFDVIWFNLSFINNAAITVEISDIETKYPVTYIFCGSLICAQNREQLIPIEMPEAIPLIILPGNAIDFIFCATGIPFTAQFDVRPQSRLASNPFYSLIIK